MSSRGPVKTIEFCFDFPSWLVNGSCVENDKLTVSVIFTMIKPDIIFHSQWGKE